MTSYPLVPAALQEHLRDAPADGGPDGATWLRRLPSLVDDCLAQWDLEAVGAPRSGWTAVVIPVSRRGEELMLKVGWPHPESATEHVALRHWAGNGAARLVAADPARGALLLEALDPERDLDQVPIDAACEVVGGLLSRLHVPAPPTVPSMTDIVAAWLEPLRQRPASLPRRAVNRALRIYDARATDPASTARLVHGDLHFRNVLAAGREPWLAIDPKPMAGHPAWELQALLRNRVEEYGTGSTFRWQVRRRVEVTTDTAGIDWDDAREWTIVHSVLQAHWAAKGGSAEETSLHLSLASALDD